jgi:hypothetical protein
VKAPLKPKPPITEYLAKDISIKQVTEGYKRGPRAEEYRLKI